MRRADTIGAANAFLDSIESFTQAPLAPPAAPPPADDLAMAAAAPAEATSANEPELPLAPGGPPGGLLWTEGQCTMLDGGRGARLRCGPTDD